MNTKFRDQNAEIPTTRKMSDWFQNRFREADQVFYDISTPRPVHDNSEYGLGQASTPWLQREESSMDKQKKKYGKSAKEFGRSDLRILEGVRQLLEEQDDVNPSSLDVSVKDGVVSLQGYIKSRQAKNRVESLVNEMLGVKEVIDSIRIRKKI